MRQQRTNEIVKIVSSLGRTIDAIEDSMPKLVSGFSSFTDEEEKEIAIAEKVVHPLKDEISKLKCEFKQLWNINALHFAEYKRILKFGEARPIKDFEAKAFQYLHDNYPLQKTSSTCIPQLFSPDTVEMFYEVIGSFIQENLGEMKGVKEVKNV